MSSLGPINAKHEHPTCRKTIQKAKHPQPYQLTEGETTQNRWWSTKPNRADQTEESKGDATIWRKRHAKPGTTNQEAAILPPLDQPGADTNHKSRHNKKKICSFFIGLPTKPREPREESPFPHHRSGKIIITLKKTEDFILTKEANRKLPHIQSKEEAKIAWTMQEMSKENHAGPTHQACMNHARIAERKPRWTHPLHVIVNHRGQLWPANETAMLFHASFICSQPATLARQMNMPAG